MATYKPYRKTTNGKEEIKIPYSVLSNPPTIPTKASDVNALSLDGGTIKKSKTIKMDASANSDGANLKWGTVNSKNPYIGYASDQVDGTFVVGSLLGTDYASGLAIGGGSGNLLWKGTKVATTSDIPTNYVKYTEQTLTDAQKSQARSNIGAGTSDFDGTWGSLSGKPNVVQSTGNSTSDVMSQKAVTDELNTKANSADLATVATSGSYNDLSNKPTIPTNYVTTDTTQNNISGRKTFTNTIVKKSNTIDLTTPNGAQWNYIEFTDKNDDRIGIAGSRFDAGGYAGVYLQARNSQQLWIASSTPDSNGNTVTKTSTPTPPATDDSTQIANTSWVRTNYQEKGYAGIDGAVVNNDGNVTDKDGNVVDALYFKVASLTTAKVYMRTYLLAEVAMTNNVRSQATVLIRCTTESSTSAPTVTITLDSYQYDKQLLAKNIFVTADYKSGTAGATFTVWVKQDQNFMQQAWNVLSQNTRNYTTTSKREWRVFYSNITKATAVTDIDTAPTGYTRIVANNNNRYSNLEENTYLWQQSQNAGITWKRYSNDATRGVLRHYDDGTTENFVVQSNGFLFRPLNNANTKAIKVDPAVGALYPEKNLRADLGKTEQRWNNAYIKNIHADNIPFDSNGLSTGTLGSTKLPSAGRYYIEFSLETTTDLIERSTRVCQVVDFQNKATATGGFLATQVLTTIQYNIYIIYITADGTITVTKSHHITDITKVSLDSGTNLSGTFKYKKLN